MNETQRKQSDIPLPAAVILLGAVLAGLAIGPDVARWEQLSAEIDAFIGRHPFVFASSVGAIVLNALATHRFARKWISYRRQGRRLRELTGEGRRDHRRLWMATMTVVGATVSYGIVLHILGARHGAELSRLPETLLGLATLNMALAAGIMSHWCWQVWLRLRAQCRASRPLAESIFSPNSIILGTTLREVAHEEGV